jgi:hypothetical protein
MPMPCDECHDFAICLSEIIKIIEIEGGGLVGVYGPTDRESVCSVYDTTIASSYKQHPLTATTPLILLFG